MSRPINETPDDKDREREVANAVAASWGVEFVETPQFTRFDYVVRNVTGDMCIAEIKCRTIKHDAFRTYIASRSKWLSMQEEARKRGIFSVWIVGYLDGVRWFKLSEVERRGLNIRFGGREDRKQEGDLEPMVYVPIDFMKVIE